jgi:signal transduction histidine kinase
MRIRTIMIAATAATLFLVAGAAAALLGVARSGREGAAYLVLSVRSVEVAQQLRLDVGQMRSGEEDRPALDASIDRDLALSQAMVQSDDEAAVIRRVLAAIHNLREARLAKDMSGFPNAIAEADHAAEELVAINVRQAHAAEREVDSSARRSETLAAIAAAALLAGVAAVLLWTRSRLLKPLQLLRDRIPQVGNGGLLAAETTVAPAEVRAVATALETMASTLKRSHTERLDLLASMASRIAPALTNIGHALDALSPSPALARLAHEVTRLRGIVEESVDAARIEEGLLELHTAPLDLTSLVAEAVDFFRQFSPANSGTALTSEAEAPMSGDARRLTQTFNHLLFLAARNAPVGGQIDVSIHGNGESWWVVVEVSRAKAASFGPLFNALRDLEEAVAGVPGSSFTFNTSRRVIAAHGGELQVSQSANGAMAFTVRLPRSASKAPWPDRIAPQNQLER